MGWVVRINWRFCFVFPSPFLWIGKPALACSLFCLVKAKLKDGSLWGASWWSTGWAKCWCCFNSKPSPNFSLVTWSLTKAIAAALPLSAAGCCILPEGRRENNKYETNKKPITVFGQPKYSLLSLVGRNTACTLHFGITALTRVVRCLPESPRWLISQGKTDKAKKIVNDIAKKNRKKMPSHFEVSLVFAYTHKNKSPASNFYQFLPVEAYCTLNIGKSSLVVREVMSTIVLMREVRQHKSYSCLSKKTQYFPAEIS